MKPSAFLDLEACNIAPASARRAQGRILSHPNRRIIVPTPTGPSKFCGAWPGKTPKELLISNIRDLALSQPILGKHSLCMPMFSKLASEMDSFATFRRQRESLFFSFALSEAFFRELKCAALDGSRSKRRKARSVISQTGRRD